MHNDKPPLYELVTESLGAMLLGFFAGLGIGTGLWIMELLGWDFDSSAWRTSDYELHLLSEAVRTSWLWYGLWALLCSTIGAVSAVWAHLRLRTSRWEPAWNKRRGDTAD
jgi:hypothetical protein